MDLLLLRLSIKESLECDFVSKLGSNYFTGDNSSIVNETFTSPHDSEPSNKSKTTVTSLMVRARSKKSVTS